MGIISSHHRQVPCKRHRVVIPQRKLLPALILQIEDELRVLAVLAREDVLPLKDGRVKAAPAIHREALLDDPLDVLPAIHLGGAVVTRTLREEKPGC